MSVFEERIKGVSIVLKIFGTVAVLSGSLLKVFVRVIKHGLNGLVYAGMLAIPHFLFANYWLIGALLFNRLMVFNIALSIFRGLKWDYISREPAAITDKIAKAVFGMNGMLMYGVYLAIFTGFIIKLFI